jgi:hypothetical protein
VADEVDAGLGLEHFQLAEEDINGPDPDGLGCFEGDQPSILADEMGFEANIGMFAYQFSENSLPEGSGQELQRNELVENGLIGWVFRVDAAYKNINPLNQFFHLAEVAVDETIFFIFVHF